MRDRRESHGVIVPNYKAAATGAFKKADSRQDYQISQHDLLPPLLGFSVEGFEQNRELDILQQLTPNSK